MKVHIRLLELELYVPNVKSNTDIHKGLAPLRRRVKDQQNIALAIEPYDFPDRAKLALTVMGFVQRDVEQESEHLIDWIERTIEGQTLKTLANWV